MIRRSKPVSLACQASALGLSILLAACGGGGGSSASSGSTTPVSTSLTGTASKGLLSNATVTAYAIVNGVAQTTPLATFTTNSLGQYTLSLGNYAGPVLVVLSSSPATTMLCDVPAGCGGTAFGAAVTPTGLTLETVVANASGNMTTALTPFTTLATEYARHLNGGLTAANIATALSQIANLFDLPDLNATQPVDITASNAGTDPNAQRYAVLNAAIAQLAGNPAQIPALLGALETEIASNNGQLVGNNGGSTTVPALASLLKAAQTVAASSQVAGKLNTLVATVITQDLGTANALPAGSATTTQATPPISASDLDKAKAFITNAHDVVQAVEAFNTGSTLVNALQSKYSVLQQYTNSDELADLTLAESAVAQYLLNQAAQAAQSGSSLTASNTAFQTWLQKKYALPSYGVGSTITATGFTFNAGASSTSTTGGTLKVQAYTSTYQCQLINSMYSCGIVTQPTGSPISFTVGAMSVNYPAGSAAATSYTVSLSPASITGPTTRLQASAGSTASLTLTINNNTQTLDQIAAADATIPDALALSLGNVELDAGATAGSSNYAASFVGNVSASAIKAFMLQAPGYSSLVPNMAQFNGTFTGIGGDTITAAVTANLITSGSLPLVEPLDGQTYPQLFTYNYNASTQTGTFGLASGVQLAPGNNWQWPTASSTVSYQWKPLGCGSSTEVLVTEAGYSWYTCTTQPTLTAYLASTQLYMSVDIANEGNYQPVIPATFNYTQAGQQTIAGIFTGNNSWVTQDSSNYAVGAVTASLKVNLTINGQAETANLNFSGNKTGYLAGNGTLTFSINGSAPLTLTGTTTNNQTTYTLSDNNGVSLTLTPGTTTQAALMVTDSGATPTQQGVVGDVGGVYIARFADNSIQGL